MNKQLSEFELKKLDKQDPFVKCIVLKIGLCESKVIAERNFDFSDEF